MLRRPLYRLLLLLSLAAVCPAGLFAQDRLAVIEQKLTQLADSASPGLKEKVEISVAGVSIQDFIRALARANRLNISVDPALNINVVNNFSNEAVGNILLFLCKEYGLEIDFTGSIMAVRKYNPPPVPVQQPLPKEIKASYNKEGDLLTLDLKSDTLWQVAKKLTQVSGKNLIYAPGLGDKPVSVYLQDLPLEDALTKLAFANDLTVTKTNNDVYLLEKAEQTAKGSSRDRKGIGSSSQSNLQVFVELDALGNKLITADLVSASIAEVIREVSRSLEIGYFMFSDLQGSATTHVEKMTYDQFLSYLFRGTEYTYKAENGIYLIGDRNLEGLRDTRLVQLQYRSADKILEWVPAELKKDVEDKAFIEQNSVVLSGSKPNIDEIEAFIRDLDKVVPVVLIEVLVVDVNKNRVLSMGLQAGIGQNKPVTGGTIYPDVDYTVGSESLNSLIAVLSGNGIFNLGNVAPNFYVNLKALETDGVVKLKSTPKLATLNGHPASMNIGETDYYLERTQNVIGTQNPQTVVTEIYKPVQANLAVNLTPIVSGDDQVTMEIDVEMSNFTSRVSPNAPPGSATRKFKSMIRVKNGEMIVLGGLDEKTIDNSGSGLPFLSRIPILKWFFSSRTFSKSTSKLTVFIRPTIIY